MLTYNYEEEDRQASQAPEHQGASLALPQRQSQGDEEASVEEPWFPDLEDAIEANQQALAEHGQSNHALLRPEVLEGALGRAKNYWFYEQDLQKAAAALIHGIGQAQAFEDGNKRTAYHLGRIFLEANGLSHISPLDHDDEELADHLIGYGEKTHGMEDTASLFSNRHNSMQSFGRTAAIEIHDDAREELEKFWHKRPDLRQECKDKYGHDPIDAAEEYWHHGLWDEPEHHEIANEAGKNGYSLELAKRWEKQELAAAKKEANILDPIHDTLAPDVWDNPGDSNPTLKPQHAKWLKHEVLRVLAEGGYDNIEDHITLIITGSITTYQYSDRSDIDTSMFVNTNNFPEWSRAEMIGLFTEELDDKLLPGTTYPLQIFVQPDEIKPEMIFKPGLRSGYDLESQQWLVPPDRTRVADIERDMNDTYTYALETADKMDRLITYEPLKAVQYWHQLHRRRRNDQKAGKGDFAPSNIAYKFVVNRGLTTRLGEIMGKKIVL